MIHVRCPSCQAALTAPPDQCAREAVCPRCGRTLVVPAAEGNRIALRAKPPMPEPLDRPPAEGATAGSPFRRPMDERKWRAVSPAFLLFSLVLFCLPFLDVRCTSGAQAGTSICTQSGLEAAYGGSTPGAPSAPTTSGPPVRIEVKDAGNPKLLPPSLLMCLYPVPLLVGVGLGLFAPLSRMRSAAVAFLAASALGLLALQTAVGFPVEVLSRPPPGGPGAEKSGIEVVYTPVLWLSFATNGCALLAVGLESLAMRRERGAPALPRRRPFVVAVVAAVVLSLAAVGIWAALYLQTPLK